MAAPPGRLRVWRYFVPLLAIIAGLYAFVFFTGPSASWQERLTPKLGLDLQGGKTVTLRAVLPDGGTPDDSQMEEAREIIAQRVNGSGVAEAEVLIEGDKNLIVNIPGKNDADLDTIGESAQMRFRKVLNEYPDQGLPEGKSVPTADPAAKAPDAEEVRGRFSQKLAGAVKQASESNSAVSAGEDQELQKELESIYELTPAEIATLPAEWQVYLPQITCEALDQRPPGSVEALDEKVAACPSEGDSKMLLDVAKVEGTDVKDAGFGLDPQRGWSVNIEFTGSGQDKWTELTREALNQQVAMVLDNVVISAPQIQNVITGQATIDGTGINRESSEDISNKLKYGALPLSFETENAQTVSPTLGEDSLRAGLLAGAIGLALVAVYCFIYYRLLGVVALTSLVVAGGIVYPLVLLLGREIGFTLTLAGVAGLIVAIGITVDSFVVFFERLKDEIRAGRTPRSSVPRGWISARRTIIAADFVSLLGAVVLYFLSIGAVKGFAFTLGLATLVDLLVVFLFTHPLVSWFSRFRTFASAKFSGLIAVEKARDERTATATPLTAKES